jgi:Zn-dependent protease with chaperone function
MSQELVALFIIIYVVVTLAAPAVLARPALLSKRPKAVLVWWFIFLAIASIALVTALVGLIVKALLHHVMHIEGHGILMPILDNIFGWLAIAVLGILAFRLGAAVSNQRHQHREEMHSVNALMALSESQEMFGYSVTVCESELRLISASPEHHTIIISTGLIDAVTPEQLKAAIVHEQAHLDGHHGVIRRIGTIALATAPGFSATTRMAQATRIATELIADDKAAEVCGKKVVADALVACYGDSSLIRERVARLS